MDDENDLDGVVTVDWIRDVAKEEGILSQFSLCFVALCIKCDMQLCIIVRFMIISIGVVIIMFDITVFVGFRLLVRSIAVAAIEMLDSVISPR